MGYTTNMGAKGAVGVYDFTYDYWKANYYEWTDAKLANTYYTKHAKKNQTETCLSSIGIRLGLSTIYDAKGGFNVETPTHASNKCDGYREGMSVGGIVGIIIAIIIILIILMIFQKMRGKGGSAPEPEAHVEQVNDTPAPPAPAPQPQVQMVQ